MIAPKPYRRQEDRLIRRIVAQPYDIALVLLGENYLQACALAEDVKFRGSTLLFCGTGMATKLPRLPNLRMVTLSNAEAKRFSCGMIGLKGELAFSSTTPGAAAIDVGPDGRHSPFALAFADAIQSNTGDVRAVFDEVAKRTRDMTGGRQSPSFSGTFPGSFSFRDRSRDRDIGVLRMAVLDICR